MRILPALFLAAVAASAAPDARHVLVRGHTKLEQALLAAIQPAERVVFVVDVTPYTRDQDKALFAALRVLDEKRATVAEWRIARLGDAASDPAPRASGLVGHFPVVFAKTQTVRSTLRALGKTIRSLPAKPTTVVYLADWHFEDDEALEAFIGTLERRRVRLSVVGSEACYGRAWNDGFFPPHRGVADKRGGTRRYDPHIGRNAFESRAERPWHGGDTAYWHLPYHFSLRWQTKFPAKRDTADELRAELKRKYAAAKKDRKKIDRREFEDLRERIRSVEKEAAKRYWFPLPSSFGPYGLMRAAGLTGGRYVLWSWNRAGRSDVRYDYNRCNLFAPDLRDRNDIRRDVRRRPLARALIKAWHEVSGEKIQVAATTPPFGKSAATPAEMVETSGSAYIGENFRTPADLRTFMKHVPVTIAALDRALLQLATALRETGGNLDAIDRRYRSDAELFHHTLLVIRFQLAEGLAAAKTLPKDAWKDKDLYPEIDPELWISGSADGDRVYDVKLHDPASGARVLEERRRLLKAYRGTPAAEMIRRNNVITYRIDWHRVGGNGRLPRTTPAESTGPKDPVTPRPPPSAPSAPPSSGG